MVLKNAALAWKPAPGEFCQTWLQTQTHHEERAGRRWSQGGFVNF